jgi:DNA repair exonuclease SbcCD ATPase subunit
MFAPATGGPISPTISPNERTPTEQQLKAKADAFYAQYEKAAKQAVADMNNPGAPGTLKKDLNTAQADLEKSLHYDIGALNSVTQSMSNTENQITKKENVLQSLEKDLQQAKQLHLSSKAYSAADATAKQDLQRLQNTYNGLAERRDALVRQAENSQQLLDQLTSDPNYLYDH